MMIPLQAARGAKTRGKEVIRSTTLLNNVNWNKSFVGRDDTKRTKKFFSSNLFADIL